jgi:hypothetical protein
MCGGNARFDEEVVEVRQGTDRGSLVCDDELTTFNYAASGRCLHSEDLRGLAL